MTAKPATSSSPHSGHRARLRQRLEREPLAVADYEVLELLLGYGLTRKDTKPLAKELLRRFGSIRGVLDARPDELLQVPGFGPGLMSLWRALRELLARYARHQRCDGATFWPRRRLWRRWPEPAWPDARMRNAGWPWWTSATA